MLPLLSLPLSSLLLLPSPIPSPKLTKLLLNQMLNMLLNLRLLILHLRILIRIRKEMIHLTMACLVGSDGEDHVAVGGVVRQGVVVDDLSRSLVLVPGL